MLLKIVLWNKILKKKPNQNQTNQNPNPAGIQHLFQENKESLKIASEILSTLLLRS